MISCDLWKGYLPLDKAYYGTFKLWNIIKFSLCIMHECHLGQVSKWKCLWAAESWKWLLRSLLQLISLISNLHALRCSMPCNIICNEPITAEGSKPCNRERNDSMEFISGYRTRGRRFCYFPDTIVPIDCNTFGSMTFTCP